MKTIRPRELHNLLENSQPVEILDVRPRINFEMGHINGAHWLPATAISPEALLYSRQLLPTEPLYLISESGVLAHMTARELERLGSENIAVVTGGMRQWQNDGLPIVRHGTFRPIAPQRRPMVAVPS
jgi:rhodanese-related sulfurtransferase